MQIKCLPEAERPREKGANQGVGTLSDTELLALILHSGTRNLSALGLAENLLGSLENGLCGLGSADIDELRSIRGIGTAKAVRLLACAELGKRICGRGPAARVSMTGAEEVAMYFMEQLRHETREHFLAALLNVKNELITYDEVSIGELSSTIVHPREAFQLAVRRSAAGVIFIHNHPSGDPTPSSEDIRTTKRLMGCGELMGIPVLDHIIIGDGVYTSLRRTGVIPGDSGGPGDYVREGCRRSACPSRRGNEGNIYSPYS
ncbi:RadC family protein [Eubacterium pyruvativorans]|uniref:RadC family protein n=1 Tax=Eubacterium pyruvativorans TaxID=155865 RepID=UPI000E8F7EEA|nr:DNA repair protein RadC [Eubacterium pyruvativorans]HAT83179.1 hypothetical protein [Eubacterium sp.]